MITKEKIFALRDDARKTLIEQEEAKKAHEQTNPEVSEPSLDLAKLFAVEADRMNISELLKSFLEGLEQKEDLRSLLDLSCQIIDTALHGYDSPYADRFSEKSQFLLNNYDHEMAFPFDSGSNGFEKILFLDIETYSTVDLKTEGLYRYASTEDFEIILLAYAYNDGLVRILDLADGEEIPEQLLRDLTDPTVLKIAHNAPFERICLSRYVNNDGNLDPSQWFCTEVYAEYLGFPGSLKGAGQALGVTDQKMAEGEKLIKFFSKPVKSKEGLVRYGPKDKPEDWHTFKDYCVRDVETDREIYEAMLNIRVFPYTEWLFWQTDQRINDLGIRMDMQMVEDALLLMQKYERALADQAESLAPGLNLRSEKQLKEYLAEHNIKTDSVDEKHISKIMSKLDKDDEVFKLLSLRQRLAKTATKKFEAFRACEVQGRAFGTLKFYGANTGRWAGKLIQPQNLPKPILHEVDLIHELLKEQKFDELENHFEDIQDVLISAIRTMLIPSEGKKFVVADYSAIEARIVAWLSGEKWVLEAFSNGEDIYCKTASQMYGVPVEKNGQNSELRAKGKIAVLACGYGGSTDAMKAFGAADFMDDQTIKDTVQAWRNANPHTCDYWYKVQNAAIQAIRMCSKERVDEKICYEGQKMGDRVILFCHLPGGRSLVYQDARITQNRWGKEDITYKSRKGSDVRIWGGKLVENITQAIARDCLAIALYRLEKAGLPVVFHVHDEIIVESENSQDLEKLCDVMGQSIKTYPGLTLKAEGYTSTYYKKD